METLLNAAARYGCEACRFHLSANPTDAFLAGARYAIEMIRQGVLILEKEDPADWRKGVGDNPAGSDPAI